MLSPENKALVERVWPAILLWPEEAQDAMATIMDAARSEGQIPEGCRPDVDAMAKAVCRERCAACGDPPCFELVGVDWDGGKCDNLHDCDCASIVRAALSASPVVPGEPKT